jgi:hypothetical protein
MHQQYHSVASLPFEVLPMMRNASDPEGDLLNLLSKLSGASSPKRTRPRKHQQTSLHEMHQTLFWQNTCTSNAIDHEDITLLRQVAVLVPQFQSPFDLFDTAKQAIVFGEDDNGSNERLANLCLLLCCWALEQIQITPPRWKRPQSVLVETLQLYQRYLLPDVQIWTQYIVPACLSMQAKLPQEAAHEDIVAGLIGTTSMLVEESPDHAKDLFRCMEPIFKSCGYSVLVRNPPPDEEDDIGMNTTRSEFGVAKLAFIAWKQDRSTVSTTDGMMHTTALLLNGDWEEGMEWLDTIDEPHQDPIPVLQLLGNRMVSLALSNRQGDAPEMSRRMSVLLQQYPSELQVDIVDQLMMTCPHPSLQAKLLDFLRPLAIHHASPPPALWVLLDGLLNDMDQSDLLLATEVHVAVLTMLKFYMLVHHIRPPCTHLGVVGRVATRIQGLPRDDVQGFRLNLLDMALEHVVSVMVEIDNSNLMSTME